ncbi:hypothetical protein Tco_1400824 [Tanacetum coccineum]
MSTRLIPTTGDRLESGVLWDTPSSASWDRISRGDITKSNWPRMRGLDSLSHKSGVYCYTKMPFGLKNTGHYQRLCEVNSMNHGSLSRMGSSSGGRVGRRLILTKPGRMEFTYALRFDSLATNNEVLGDYVAKEDNMIQYLDKTKSLIQGFDRFTIRQVLRGDNKKADAFKTTLHKWIEAKAVATIKGNQGNMIFGIHCRAVLDDWRNSLGPMGTVSVINSFKNWCARLRITLRFASLNTTDNGLVEAQITV